MPFDFQTPSTGSNRMKLSKNEYRNGILGVLLFLLVIFLYAFEFKHFSNTFGIEKMVVRSIIFGGFSGAVIAFFYSKRYSDPLDRMKTYVFFVIILLMVAPLFASLSNRYLSSSESILEESKRLRDEAYEKIRKALDL